jgi:aspartate-semialdehyde dehydrogenase
MNQVAVIGATGAVGREMLAVLEESDVSLPVTCFASPRSEGQTVSYRGKSLTVRRFDIGAFTGQFKYALMSAGGAFSREWSPALVSKGVTVIDNSSAWRMEPGVPLIVPEVNKRVLQDFAGPGIIANPNCSTIQMVVALKPLQERFKLNQVIVSTYQSVSGTGQKGIDELATQVKQHLQFAEPTPQVYAQPIAFNVLPAIDRMVDGGHCYEEVKMVLETQKIMSEPNLPVFATTVRVPTVNCHSESVTVRLGQAVTRAELLAALKTGEGMILDERDDHKTFPTPREVAGKNEVFVSRARLPYGQERSEWVQFWVVADNLRKGAATNAVQILSCLQK